MRFPADRFHTCRWYRSTSPPGSGANSSLSRQPHCNQLPAEPQRKSSAPGSHDSLLLRLAARSRLRCSGCYDHFASGAQQKCHSIRVLGINRKSGETSAGVPLPSDEKLVALANDLLAQFDQIFGLHPGFRPAHAKGAMLSGVFTPSDEAKSLSRAPHFRRESTPVTVRFSNSTGIPVIPDNDANADPRGIAIRFHLGDRVHTDIVAHSTDGFPAHDGVRVFWSSSRALAATWTSRRGSPNPFGGVSRNSSSRSGLCAGAQACAVELCP